MSEGMNFLTLRFYCPCYFSIFISTTKNSSYFRISSRKIEANKLNFKDTKRFYGISIASILTAK